MSTSGTENVLSFDCVIGDAMLYQSAGACDETGDRADAADMLEVLQPLARTQTTWSKATTVAVLLCRLAPLGVLPLASSSEPSPAQRVAALFTHVAGWRDFVGRASSCSWPRY